MDNVPVQIITQAVKDITLTGLDLLVKHNIKGADIIRNGLNIASEIMYHNDQLYSILNILKPVFNLVRGWLEKEHPYLLAIFDWAKTIADILFGTTKQA